MALKAVSVLWVMLSVEWQIKSSPSCTSVPDEGPLTDYETWMPDFMSGLAKGIEKSKGMVASAMDGVAADMVVDPKISTADTSGALAVHLLEIQLQALPRLLQKHWQVWADKMVTS